MAVITISNETGCGKEICDALEERLQYKIINKDIVRYAATIGGIDPVKAKQLDEGNYSKIKALLSEYLDFSLFSPSDLLTADKDEVKHKHNYRPYEYASSPSGENFQQSTEKVIRMLANEGNIMILGRGGNFILADKPDTIHIRIIAPLDIRIKHVMQAMNISEAAAKKHIQEVDSRKASYISNYFKADISAATNYTLLLNEARINVQKVAQAIVLLA